MISRPLLVTLSAAALIAAGAIPIRAQPHAQEPESREPIQDLLRVPASMAEEHRALHAGLEAAMAAGGRTGEAARVVEAHLGPHFEEENRYALPPLGLLPHLATDGATEEMRPAIEMARHVEQNLDRFLEEHRNITAALDELERAARAEGKPEQIRFVAELHTHAQQEEDLFYPMTILIGRYLEERLR